MKPMCFILSVCLVIGLATSLTDAGQPIDREVDNPLMKPIVEAMALGRSTNQRKNSRMSSKETSRTIEMSSIVKKITDYIANYTSATATWLKYPYYGISTGVASVMVLMVVIYILIVASGTVSTTGRSLIEHLGVDGQDLDRMTQLVTKAIDAVANKVTDGQWDNLTEARKWVASSGWPSWSAAITQVDTVGEYISEHLYDKLIWLSKPYAGYILSMGVVILYMVVIVMIVMTSNVFPIIPATGRQLEGQEFNLIRTAETVMKAINMWDRKNIEDTEKED